MAHSATTTFTITAASLAVALLATAGCMESADSSSRTVQPAAAPSSATVQRRSEFPHAEITVDHDGCPIEFTEALSPDEEAYTFRFSEFMLTPDRRSFRCRIGIDYQVPAGWRFWRPSVTARGFQALAASGQHMAWALRTRVDGEAWASQFSMTEGPVQDNVQIDVEDGEAAGEEPTPCGATSAHIDVELLGGLSAPGGPDQTYGTMDSIETAIDWERCE